MWSTRTRPERGPKFSLGSQVLGLVLARIGWSQTRLKSVLGTANAVSYWIHGDRSPSSKWAFRLEEVLKIPAGLWGRQPWDEDAQGSELRQFVEKIAGEIKLAAPDQAVA